jgi:hypothetical protein
VQHQLSVAVIRKKLLHRFRITHVSNHVFDWPVRAKPVEISVRTGLGEVIEDNRFIPSAQTSDYSIAADESGPANNDRFQSNVPVGGDGLAGHRPEEGDSQGNAVPVPRKEAIGKHIPLRLPAKNVSEECQYCNPEKPLVAAYGSAAEQSGVDLR